MADTDTRKWCWNEPRSDEAFGPFESRDAAVADAQKSMREQTDWVEVEIEIGRVNPAYSEEHSAVLDVDRLLEDMDTHAEDNGFGFADDAIFEVKDRDAAQASLEALLAVWAKAYVTAGIWAVGEPIERVTIRLREDPPSVE